jgi:hypothetical protein
VPSPPETPEVLQVNESPTNPESGDTEQEPAMAGLETVTVVHGPQLLSSFDSVMEPTSFRSLLSAQTRSEYVPMEAKEYDLLKVLVLPAARVGITTAGRTSVIVPPPLMAVATCRKFLKREPVLPVPTFLTMELNVVAVPVSAVVGEMRSVSLIVRSGSWAQVLVVLVHAVFEQAYEQAPEYPVSHAPAEEPETVSGSTQPLMVVAAQVETTQLCVAASQLYPLLQEY